MNFRRFTPFLVSVTLLALLEIYLFKPSSIYIIVALIDLIIIYSAKKMSQKSLIERKWWNFIILPILYIDSFVLYSTLLPFKSQMLAIQSLLIANIAFTFFYYRSVYYHLVLPASSERYSLENISSFGTFVSFFYLAASAFGLASFLNIDIWILVLLIAGASFFLTYQVIWANKMALSSGIIFTLISALILSEIAWTMFYLPFNFNIMGACLAIDFYILIGLIRAYLKKRLDARIVKLYLSLGFITLFLILITSRWI